MFYAAGLVPASLGPVRQFGWTLVVFAAVGYVSMLCLVGRRFGLAAGVLAGTLFLTFPYAITDLYIRGDLPEFAAMMLLPGLWLSLDCSLGRAAEKRSPVTPCGGLPASRSDASTLPASGNRWAVLGVAVCGAVLVVMHPCIALFGYGFSVAGLGFLALGNRQPCSAGSPGH